MLQMSSHYVVSLPALEQLAGFSHVVICVQEGGSGGIDLEVLDTFYHGLNLMWFSSYW